MTNKFDPKTHRFGMAYFYKGREPPVFVYDYFEGGNEVHFVFDNHI
jgi:hypothetical protein